MVKSMTGFGKSTLSKEKRDYQMEIKSVNHRYLDITIKMPKTLSYLEDEIKKEISSKIKRGKVDVYITYENGSQEGRNITINKELAKLYINQLKELAQEEQISDKIEFMEIAKLPDILSIKVDEEDEKIKQEVIELTQEATDKISQMRKTEGEKIAQDLLERINKIESKIIEISKNYGAYGVNVAHSGTVVGILIDKSMNDTRLIELLKNERLDSVYKKMYTSNIIDGGIRGEQTWNTSKIL